MPKPQTETNLKKLLQNLKPQLQEGNYVFCTLNTHLDIPADQIQASFQEKEGRSLILKQEIADHYGLAYEGIFSRISLAVYSALEAVGLTASVAQALTEANISANIVAAFHHDHLFVPKKDALTALVVLQELSQRYQ